MKLCSHKKGYNILSVLLKFFDSTKDLYFPNKNWIFSHDGHLNNENGNLRKYLLYLSKSVLYTSLYYDFISVTNNPYFQK